MSESHNRGSCSYILTIEDESVFAMPWTAIITYAPGPTASGKVFARENRGEYYQEENSKESDVSKAEQPNF